MTGLPEFGLAGRTVAVTGAGRGIGRAIALDVAAAGATVVACHRTPAELASLREEVEQGGGRCETLTVDVAKKAGVEELVEFTCATCGSIDGLVNNAGVNVARDALDYTEDEVDLLIELNLKAVYWSCVVTARRMIAQGRGGVIVNITSQAGLVGAPFRAPYSGAKAGANNLTRTFAAEWAKHGIRVNALAPTITLTPLVRQGMEEHPELVERLVDAIPLGRAAEVREMSLPTVFLLSDAASMMTGHTLVVDGGWSIV